MLPKKERLSRNAFNRFFSAGKRFHSSSFQIVYAEYPTLHVSVVIPKKVEKSAVKRNKIRRRTYDIVRNYRQEKGVQGVFIFLAKPSLASVDYETMRHEVRAEIESILKKSVTHKQ